MPVIQTQQLTRLYGHRRGISDVNLAIEAGSLYGFLGPNGAGKTTTIRVLLGFLRPSFGEARIFGRDCWRESALIKEQVGYVPGDLRLWPWLTGHSALSLFSRIRGREMRSEGQRLAEVFELDLSVKVRSMSRGMRQKLGLILAMAHRPKLLVLDEPSSALDPLMQDRFRELLREAAGRGSTVFFSSHTLSEVEALCERVAIVKSGRIVADSTLESLRKQARQEVSISWADGVGERIERPRFLRLRSATADSWTGYIEDQSLRDFIEFLRGKPVSDLRITRPDLETIFRRYYDPDVSDDAQAGVEEVELTNAPSSTASQDQIDREREPVGSAGQPSAGCEYREPGPGGER
jgi:ABC-2 type transport system ATP-binding protein